MIKLETKYTKRIITESMLTKLYQSRVNKIIKKIKNGSAKGVDMTGWIKYAQHFDKNELNKMIETANDWNQSKIKKIVVIGIGGSYLGIKAGMNMLSSEFYRKRYQIYFAHNMNHNFLVSLLKSIGTEPFGIIFISKSGTTLEPSIAFELFYSRLVTNVGAKNANKFVAAITSKNKGILCEQAKLKGWAHFIIPNNIGGRYSALTPTGMFLFILLGFDYKSIIRGAKDAANKLSNPNLRKNDAFKYACYRNYFRTFHRYGVENFVVYDPGLSMIGEVWKQLFGESEGKDHKALYPTTSLFTTDLHSMGQYLQDGTRNFFETTLYVNKPIEDLKLNMKNEHFKYLNGKKLSYINKIAMLSTINAHYEQGKTKNLIIYVDRQDAYHFGYLYTWLCFAAMMSAYLLRLNPFDQPGVEIYKQRIANILNNK